MLVSVQMCKHILYFAYTQQLTDSSVYLVEVNTTVGSLLLDLNLKPTTSHICNVIL